MKGRTPPGLGTRLVALACYLAALAGLSAWAGFVLLLGLDLLPTRAALPEPWPWVVDLAWLVIFAVQHSGMARTSFKNRWTRWLPPRLERSVYAALSGLLLLGLTLTWQPLDGAAIWRGPTWLVAVPLTAGLCLTLVNLRFDHLGLFGVRQAWDNSDEPSPERLWVLGVYRYIRHPLMACMLVFLWAQPVMAPTLAVLAGGLTLYIGIGIVLEERDLLRRFGPAYAEYRRQVPALVPWRRPASPGVYPEVR